MLNDVLGLFATNLSLFVGIVFVGGLLVGSFLNVVIYRLPIMLERQWAAQAAELAPVSGASPDASTVQAILETPPRLTLSTPPSACPSCKAPIKPWQNVPVVSWLLLRGRCASCNNSISARYPLVELCTAVLSGWVAWRFGWGIDAACALLLTWSLIALTGIDFDHQLLPDNITLPLLWAGLLAAALIGHSTTHALPVSPVEAIVGAVCGYGSLWLVFQAFRLITGKEGMGYGDFKLFAALGAWLGWKSLPLVIVLAAGTGAVLGIVLIVFRGRDRAAPMPFGPYLAIAGWLAMMYGDAWIDAYLRMSGLRH